jgi:hypothetical protein
VLPFSEALGNVGRAKINGRPEFFQIGALRSLDLAIEMGRAWLDGAELDRPIHQPLLHLLGKEFPATIRLNALDRNGISSINRSRKSKVLAALRRG